jgi:hypothetical protein
MLASKLILLSGLILFLLLVVLSSLSLNWWELVIFVVVATSGYGVSLGFKRGQRRMRLRAFVGVILIAFSLIITFSDGSVVWPFKSHKFLTVALLSMVFLILAAYLAKMVLRRDFSISLSEIDKLFLSSAGVGFLASLWLRIYFKNNLLINNLPIGLLACLIIYPAIVEGILE